jgi:hypothetical protein
MIDPVPLNCGGTVAVTTKPKYHGKDRTAAPASCLTEAWRQAKENLGKRIGLALRKRDR